MRVVLEVASEVDVAQSVRETEAQFVIWAANGEPPRRAHELLELFPRLRVLVIKDDGRRSCLYELRRQALGQMSGEKLVEAIRGGTPS